MKPHDFNRRYTKAILGLGLATCLLHGGLSVAAGSVDFARDVRPILTDKCFACHGPDQKKRKADLRLDTHEGALVDLGGYRAIDPGKPEKSALVDRVTNENADERMPPEKSGKTLSSKEITILRHWIKQGANYEIHWAYRPVTRPAPPNARGKEFVVNDIDRFVLAKILEQDLPNPTSADRVTLARRLYYDLLGMPPMPREVDAFVNNTSARAYEDLVERLLNDPRYGERMAMHWLDLVRYADTIGYHSDSHRQVSAFRDYVIEAFNSNMPYDQFTIEQLAGDLLHSPSMRQKIASGYNRLLQTTEEGGAQAKEYRAIYAADRVRNVSAVWMGATLGCAQCHDHKYDPYTMKDFYSMAAFFADIKEPAVGRQPPNLRLPAPEQTSEIARLNHQIEMAGALEYAATMGAVRTFRSSGALDLEGRFAYAINVGSDEKVTLQGVRFSPGKKGIDGYSPSMNPASGNSGQHAEDGLKKLLGTLRADNAARTLRLRVKTGNRYKLQLLVREPNGAGHQRNFSVNLNGRSAVDNLITTPRPGEYENESLVYTMETVADSDELAIHFVPGSRAGGSDPNPILNALTLEDVTGQAHFARPNSLTALAEAQAKWEAANLAKLAADKDTWQFARPASVKSSGGSTLTIRADHSVLASGTNPDKDNYDVTFKPASGRITAFRLEALTHPSLTAKSLSRANGNFVLTHVEAELRTTSQAEPVKLEIGLAEADFEQKNHPVKLAIDNDPATGWAVQGWERKHDNRAIFTFKNPLDIQEGGELLIRLKHESVHAKHSIGRFRIAFTAVDKPGFAPGVKLPGDVLAAVKTPVTQRSARQRAALLSHHHTIAPELAGQRKQVEDWKKRIADIQKSVRTMLIAETEKPRVMRVLARGNWLDDSGEKVVPNVPAFLLQPTARDGRATRLDLAQWLVNPRNPVTARAFVNRLWKLFFGAGLSRRLDDMGGQGEPPSHPELLDWLAAEFIASDWDVKHMVRLLVTSDIYRQVSTASPELLESDPNNRFFARQGRFRVDAEMVRDAALAISGLLVEQTGGFSAKPYQPVGYWQHLNFPKRSWKHDQGEGLYRRGLYTFWCRTFLHPSLLAFDAPSREECTAERARSNTPQQALVLLNDPVFVEAARVFAEGILRHGGARPESRLAWAFRRALSRPPDKREREILLTLYRDQLRRYQADHEAARQVATAGDSPGAKDLDAIEVAAWSSVTRAILNLYETTSRF